MAGDKPSAGPRRPQSGCGPGCTVFMESQPRDRSLKPRLQTGCQSWGRRAWQSPMGSCEAGVGTGPLPGSTPAPTSVDHGQGPACTSCEQGTSVGWWPFVVTSHRSPSLQTSLLHVLSPVSSSSCALGVCPVPWHHAYKCVSVVHPQPEAQPMFRGAQL